MGQKLGLPCSKPLPPNITSELTATVCMYKYSTLDRITKKGDKGGPSKQSAVLRKDLNTHGKYKV